MPHLVTGSDSTATQIDTLSALRWGKGFHTINLTATLQTHSQF